MKTKQAEQTSVRFAPVSAEIQALGERTFRKMILNEVTSAKAKRSQDYFTRIMNENILFPGTTFLVTSRGFAYSWLKAQGWSESERGFGSLDYTIFSKKPVDAPLSDEAFRDEFLNKVQGDFAR
jgi:hypothetical protein